MTEDGIDKPLLPRSPSSTRIPKRALFLFPTILFYGMTALSSGLVFTLLLEEILCENSPDHDGGCKNDPSIKERTAVLSGNLASVSGVTQLLAVGFIGSLSDRTGRRIVLLLATVGQLVSLLIALAVLLFHLVPADATLLLVAGGLLNGLTGGYAAFLAASFAYAADMTAPQDRALVFGIAESMLFISSAAGPLFIGFVADELGVVWSVAMLCILTLLCALSILLLPPSTNSPFKPSTTTTTVATSVTTLRENVCVRTCPCLRANTCTALMKLLSKPTAVLLVALAFQFDFVGLLGTLVCTTQYTQTAFDWSPVEIGANSAFYGVARSLGVWFLLPLALRGPSWARLSPLTVMRCGAAFGVIISVAYFFAQNGVVFLCLSCLECVHGLLLPLGRNTISLAFPPHQQGAALTIVAILESASSLWAPAAYGYIFSTLLEHNLSQYVYVCVAGCSALALLALLCTSTSSLEASKFKTEAEEGSASTSGIRSDGAVQERTHTEAEGVAVAVAVDVAVARTNKGSTEHN